MEFWFTIKHLGALLVINSKFFALIFYYWSKKLSRTQLLLIHEKGILSR